MTIHVIAFDADDTLWHNEPLYRATQAKLQQLLAPHVDQETVTTQLYETEMANLPHYGYGIKSFALSMIETAVELTEGRISGRDIATILSFAKEMIAAETALIDGARETIVRLSRSYRLMLITKGDLRDQENKLARSGLGSYFDHVEIVSLKTAQTYRRLLAKHEIEIEQFLMVGNSLRSDILPVVDIGAQAVHIPYHITWAHETLDDETGTEGSYHRLDRLDQLPDLIERIDAKGPSS
jgi:putative hydrolase of the HAD superfamily